MPVPSISLKRVALCWIVFGLTGCGPEQPALPVDAADSEAMRQVYAAYGVSVSRRAGNTLYIGGLVAFEDDDVMTTASQHESCQQASGTAAQHHDPPTPLHRPQRTARGGARSRRASCRRLAVRAI